MVEILMDLDEVIKELYKVSTKQNADYSDVSVSTINKYRSLENMPTIKTLQKFSINPKRIDLSRLVIYVNAENNRIITSNAKKIFNLLVVGDSKTVDPKGCLKSRKDSYSEVFDYLDKQCNVMNCNDHAKEFDYHPGRTVSRAQICDLGKLYAYSPSKVNAALENLEKNKIIKLVKKGENPNKHRRSEKDLYNFSISGCERYISKKIKAAKKADGAR